MASPFLYEKTKNLQVFCFSQDIGYAQTPYHGGPTWQIWRLKHSWPPCSNQKMATFISKDIEILTLGGLVLFTRYWPCLGTLSWESYMAILGVGPAAILAQYG